MSDDIRLLARDLLPSMAPGDRRLIAIDHSRPPSELEGFIAEWRRQCDQLLGFGGWRLEQQRGALVITRTGKPL